MEYPALNNEIPVHIGFDFCDPSKSFTCVYEFELPSEPITEDAEFEVIEPKMIEYSKDK